MLDIHTLCTLPFIWLKLISIIYLEKIALLSMKEAICKSMMALKILVHFKDCKNSISLQRRCDSEPDFLLSSDASLTYFYYRLFALMLQRNRSFLLCFSGKD